jgi:hypothetical protein
MSLGAHTVPVPSSPHSSLTLPVARTGGDQVGLAISIALVALLVVGGSLVLYDHVYRAWPWSTYPNPLHVCGRDFQPAGPSVTRAQITRGGDHLVRHGDVPGIFNTSAVWTTDAERGVRLQMLPGGCNQMWVQGGPGEYRPYSLEGGP